MSNTEKIAEIMRLYSELKHDHIELSVKGDSVTLDIKAFLRMFGDFTISGSRIGAYPLELSTKIDGWTVRAYTDRLRTLDIGGGEDA